MSHSESWLQGYWDARNNQEYHSWGWNASDYDKGWIAGKDSMK